jgi:uncharacterized protein with beta-barrel porin domain
MGVDREFSAKFTGGLLGNFTNTHANLDGVGSGANIGGFGGGIYGGWSCNHWYANGLLTYDCNTYDSHRRGLFPGFDRLALAHTDGDQLVADLTIGRDAHRGLHWTAGPEFGMQYVHLAVEDFAENGFPGIALNVSAQTVKAFLSRCGNMSSTTAVAPLALPSQVVDLPPSPCTRTNWIATPPWLEPA